MLTLQGSQVGVTLVEVLIGLAVVAILLMFGTPTFSTWIQNVQIRTAAESIQNGLQLARGTAVQRNTSVRFQLTDSVTSACGLSTAGTNWVISLDDPTGACDTPASDVMAPRIIQARPSAEGSRNAVVAADQSAIVFGGAGRVTPVPLGNIQIDVSNPMAGNCAPGGPMRCLRIVVTAGGQIRMCDPALPSTDPRGC